MRAGGGQGSAPRTRCVRADDRGGGTDRGTRETAESDVGIVVRESRWSAVTSKGWRACRVTVVLIPCG